MPDISLMTGVSGAEKVISDVPKGKSSSPSSAFDQVLSGKLGGTSEMGQKVVESFGISSMTPKAAPMGNIPSAQIDSSQEIRTHGKILDLLETVNRDALQMDNLVKMMTDNMTSSNSGSSGTSSQLSDTAPSPSSVSSVGEDKISKLKTQIQTEGMNAADLLTVQWKVHSFALEIDLTSKIMEQVSSGTKQLLNTNFA